MNAALTAVIVSAALSLFDLGNVTRLYRMRRSGFAPSMVCFAGVLMVGVVQGISFRDPKISRIDFHVDPRNSSMSVGL
jgi:hypothetical protein